MEWNKKPEIQGSTKRSISKRAKDHLSPDVREMIRITWGEMFHGPQTISVEHLEEDFIPLG